MAYIPSVAFTIAILAGGRSRRMGADKSFVKLRGKPLIEYTLEAARQVSRTHDNAPIILITNKPNDYAAYALPIFPDVIPDKGSLGGLYTALTHSQTEHTLCVACDMPFLNAALLGHLVSLRNGYDVVIPRVDGWPETMHAVYSKACLGPMRALIDRDRLQIIGFFDQVRVQYVESETLRRYDPDLRSFINVNTPEELARYEQ